ncbi:MAG: O-antigen ligase family protein [Acidobacteriota bacterium]|nr:O-antigen ligase family protein [Acidobacteriota bacterium]
MPPATPTAGLKISRGAAFGHRIALVGFILFAAFAPHSIAGAEIALGIAAAGWLIRTLTSRRTGLRRTKLDLPIWLFFLWTVVSALLSSEPRISIAKLQSVCVLFVFYLTQAIVTRRSAVLLASLMIVSGVAGTLWSVVDLARGRGIVVESIAADSPFRSIETVTGPTPGILNEPPLVQIEKGDTIWRVGGQRIYSTAEVDQIIKQAKPRERLSVSAITHGEHAEWPGLVVTERMQAHPSPSGISGSERLHRFRASGWTGHYAYFAEILQILAQLSLGLALANFQNHGPNRRFKLALIASGLLAFGIAFTAMRSVLVAFAIGGCVLVWRAARGATARFLVTAAIAFILGFGVVVVWQTRAHQALSLGDDSSSLRRQVARVGLARVLNHPLFGHGMDAVKLHWSEWGFPGTVLIHLHSTPLQIAFDRGLPALVFWLWIMFVFWKMVSRGERATRDSGDTNRHGMLLGATGALAGFFVSSLVNYNFGAGIVALVFWWLMGTVIVLAKKE